MRRVQGLFFPDGNSCRRHKANKSPTCTIRPSHKCWEPRKYSFSGPPIGAINPRSLCYQLGWKKQRKAEVWTNPFSPAGPWLGTQTPTCTCIKSKSGPQCEPFFYVSRCQNPKPKSLNPPRSQSQFFSIPRLFSATPPISLSQHSVFHSTSGKEIL